MKKVLLILFTGVLIAGIALGASDNLIDKSGNFISGSTMTTPNAGNAYWDIYDDGGENVLACNKHDTSNEYADGDDAICYNNEGNDFATWGYASGTLSFEYELLGSDIGDDYGEFLYAIAPSDPSDIGEYTLIETFDTATTDNDPPYDDVYTLDLTNVGGENLLDDDDVYFMFHWVSDLDTDVGPGWKIDNAGVDFGTITLIDVDFEDESLPGDWTVYDYSGSYEWEIYNDGAIGTSWCMWNYWLQTADDYIVTQQLDLEMATSAEITYWYRTDYAGYGDTFDFMVSTGSGDPVDAEFVTEINYPDATMPTTWTEEASYDMSSYCEEEIYLAWYHGCVYGGSYLVDQVVFDADFGSFDPFDNLDWWDTDESGNSTITNTSLGNIKSLFE
jgi:hypothetical protein